MKKGMNCGCAPFNKQAGMGRRYLFWFCLGNLLMAVLPCFGQAAPGEKIPVSKIVMGEMSRKGLSAGMNKYASLKHANAGAYQFNEEQLNMVADSLISKNRVVDALEVLKTNVKVYPDSPVTHARLGHGYVLNGDNELAASAYEKTLTLGGQDETVKRNLRLLKNADGATAYYVCAPCACANHKLKFIHQGKCPACAMQLVQKK